MQEIDFPTQKPRTYEIPDARSDSKHRTVLFVEDDTVFADTIKEALEIHGYRVTTALNGVEGVQQILAADFDAILCDMVMPNMRGRTSWRATSTTRLESFWECGEPMPRPT